MISHFFIHKPIFASVISLVIMLIGGFALFGLPVERYPNISPPTITVQATYPGADAATIADTVGAPIEQEVNGVEGMIYMNSISSNDGTYQLTITFETGTDLDIANVLVQNRVQAATAKLPPEVQRLGLPIRKKSNETTMYVGFVSTDGSMGALELTNYVTIAIKDELSRVPGVSKVDVFGMGDYAMRLWLDPDKLRARGLTVNDVVNAVSSQNVQVAAGQIGEPPIPTGQPFQYTLRVKGRLADIDEFENIVVRTGDDGQMLRIRDIGRAELGAKTYSMSSTLSGKSAVAIAVYQIPGANALDVVEGINTKLEELSKRFPAGLEHVSIFENTRVIKASIKEVVVTLFITLFLVVLTVYVFLQNVRATLIPSVTIPVALIGTFAAMAAIGYSINTFTLFGLVLVIGIVVDDAIVVVENTTRLIDDQGLAPKEAAKKAMDEITGPVIATTLVLLSVFVPTGFMPGITGQLFKQFSVTISVATCFSTLNALTLSPALCGVILRPTPAGAGKTGFFGLFNRLLNGTRAGYERVVSSALRHAVIGTLLFAGMSAAAVFGFASLPGGFVPQEDEGYCLLTVMLPDAASFERTDAFMTQVYDALEPIEGIENIMMVTGYSVLDSSAAPNMGFAAVIFDDWKERGAAGSQPMLLMRINKALSQLQDGLGMAFPIPSLPGVGVSGGLTMMLQDRGGIGLGRLEQMAQEWMHESSVHPALTGMFSPFRASVPQLFVNINRDGVLTKQVSLDAVFNALQYYLGSIYINDFTLFNRNFQVKAQADPTYRVDASQIRNLEVRNYQGKMLPIGAIATVEEMAGPQIISRYNILPSARVMAQPGPGYSSGQAMEVAERLATQNLGNAVNLAWTDMSYQEKAAQGSTSIIFLLAIVMVYLVLAAQYESWTIPISVCLSVPTALLGAVIALVLRGMDANVYAQVGVVLLIGLSTKTAILIVEFAKVERESGKSLFEAAMSAARLRFRAVLMTAFSFILGVFPLVVASGAGAKSRQALGTTVFGGMLVATVASLVFVPMLYLVVQAIADKLTGVKEPATTP